MYKYSDSATFNAPRRSSAFSLSLDSSSKLAEDATDGRRSCTAEDVILVTKGLGADTMTGFEATTVVDTSVMATLEEVAGEVVVVEVDAVAATAGGDDNTAADTADVDTGVLDSLAMDTKGVKTLAIVKGRVDIGVDTGLVNAFAMDEDARWVNVLGSGNGRMDAFEVFTVPLDVVTVDTG